MYLIKDDSSAQKSSPTIYYGIKTLKDNSLKG